MNVSSLTFKELPSQYEPTVEAIGAQKFGVSKVGQNMKYQEVSEKRQIDGEMAMCWGVTMVKGDPMKPCNF